MSKHIDLRPVRAIQRPTSRPILFRNVDKPKETVILFKWSRLDAARKFARSKDLRARMKRAGVMGKPDICFLEEAGHARA